MTAWQYLLGGIVTYTILMLLIGEYSRRRTEGTREDYFMASRRFGAIALFFSILATTVSAFGILGVSGLAYREGFAQFGYTAVLGVLVGTVTFATIGYRIWMAGKVFKIKTPGQFLNHRYDTSILGPVTMAILSVWTVPYIVIGAQGGGQTLEAMTGGIISYRIGIALILGLVLLYVVAGGMRGTTYTNMFQGAFMLLFVTTLLGYVLVRHGGAVAATQAVRSVDPGLLTRAGSPVFSTKSWLSFALLPVFAQIMFPQIMIRIMTGLSNEVMKRTAVLLAVGTLLLNAPVTLIGIWGRPLVPGLTGTGADRIVPLLVENLFPGWIAGFGLVAILSAVMSSMDAQTLTVSTLISEDLLHDVGHITEKAEIWIAKGIVGLLLLTAFIGAYFQVNTIFAIGKFAFSGFALVFYPFIVGLYWKRATASGVLAGLLWGFTGVILFTFGILPEGWLFGFLPFIPLLVVQVPLVHTVSYLTDRPPRERIEAHFDLYEKVW